MADALEHQGRCSLEDGGTVTVWPLLWPSADIGVFETLL